MKVVAFNGSARPAGNTTHLLKTTLAELEKEGIETELIQLAGRPLAGCIACYQCMKSKDGRCAVTTDDLNSHVEKMAAADGILLGSPTYFADLSASMKALIERAGFVGRANGDLYRRKVGASVVAVRRSGAIHAFDSMNHFFTISQMIIVGSNYWNIGVGLEPGSVEKDEEGIRTMATLGANMAWLLGKLKP